MWKMAIHNLIIFITHLKKYHMLKTKCLWNSSGSNKKKLTKHGREPRNLEFLNFFIIFLNDQHVGKPIFQLSTPKEKKQPHLI